MARTKRARARCSTRAWPPPGRAGPNRCLPGAEPDAAREPRVRCRRPESRAVAAARRGAGTRTMAGSRGRGPGAGDRLSRSDVGATSVETRRKLVGRVSERRPGESERLSRFLPALCRPAPHSPPPGSRRPAPTDLALAAECPAGRGGGNETPAPGVGGRFDGTGGRLGRRCSTAGSDQAAFLKPAPICRLGTTASLPIVMWLALGPVSQGWRGFCPRESRAQGSSWRARRRGDSRGWLRFRARDRSE
jgi:hypothetical protein